MYQAMSYAQINRHLSESVCKRRQGLPPPQLVRASGLRRLSYSMWDRKSVCPQKKERSWLIEVVLITHSKCRECECSRSGGDHKKVKYLLAPPKKTYTPPNPFLCNGPEQGDPQNNYANVTHAFSIKSLHQKYTQTLAIVHRYKAGGQHRLFNRRFHVHSRLYIGKQPGRGHQTADSQERSIHLGPCLCWNDRNAIYR